MQFAKRMLAMVLGLAWVPLSAGVIDQALDIETQTLRNSARSQQKIDRLDEAGRKNLDEYRRVLREIKSLKTYNKHLDNLIASQQQQTTELEGQIQAIAEAEREIVPLMMQMVETLDRFVKLDLPFLPEERHHRVKQLQDLLNSVEISTAEKFRRILESYQIENDYARTIEAYRAELDIENTRRPVDFLRIGRVALFYQTLDGATSGFWNPRQKRWETLPDDYRRSIRQGLRIARKEAAPDLLILPMPTPETEK